MRPKLALRLAAFAALGIAVVVAAVVLLRSGESYTVHARFLNAAQLVKGNLVQVSGQDAGKVKSITVTPDGQADVALQIDKHWAPLRQGTQAMIRQASLSGVANRYVDLRLAPQRGHDIPDGGRIDEHDTTTAVDLDQLFNTFDEPTRQSLSSLLQGLARQHDGRGEQMNAAFAYLNPALSSSSRLFRELNRDTPLLERFIVSSSELVTDLADRREDLSGLVDNLATTTTAIGTQQQALASAIGQLPPFMKRANTTFLNLRATLDDLDPLVAESKPVAKKLRPFMAQLRPLAQDARPTLRDLSRLVKGPNQNDDLIDLTLAAPRLADVTTGKVNDHGEERDGAFPASTKALEGGTPMLSYWRPYSADLIGWFDDFSHSGVYDALGAVSRAGLHASAFTLASGQLLPVPPELRGEAFKAGAELNQRNRCPGAAEHGADDGSNPFKPSGDFNCDPSETLPGP
jgi:phospholipid/cholesterol/gamma-HCH transport system substrate-binding protein